MGLYWDKKLGFSGEGLGLGFWSRFGFRLMGFVKEGLGLGMVMWVWLGLTLGQKSNGFNRVDGCKLGFFGVTK